MGNTQSHESEPAAAAEVADLQDHFDLSEIPDDRELAEQDAQPDTYPGIPKSSTPAQIQEQNGSKRGTKKKRQRRMKTSSNKMNNETSNNVLNRMSPSPDTPPEMPDNDQPLRETEPEIYDQYVMSDQSDAEEGDGLPRGGVANSFVAVNGPSQRITAGARNIDADDTENEEEKAVAPIQNPQVATQPSTQKSASQAGTKIPEPKTNNQGRFLCPYADVYGCKTTLVDRRGALKHASNHKKTNGSTNHVETAPKTAVHETTSAVGTAIPEPRTNVNGRFLCPFADTNGCGVTFVDRRGAMRHAKSHMKTEKVDIEEETGALLTDVETATMALRTVPAPRTEIPAPRVNSEGRFLCPFAEVEECGKIFASKRSAARHGNVHTTNFVCIVCKKQLDARDKLVSHLKTHSAVDVAAVTNVYGGPQQEQDGEEQPPGEADEEAEAEEDGAQDEDATEFATPQNTPPETNQPNSVEKIVQGAQGVVDTEILDAGSVEDASDEPSEAGSERGSIAQPSVLDEGESVVKETPMLTGKLKRKREKEARPQATHSSPERTRKRRRALLVSPPTLAPSQDTVPSSTLKASTVTAAARSRQITEKIVPQLQSKKSSLDGWAQKFTPGSKLKHPTLNPTPPRPGTQLIEVVIPSKSQAGPSGPQPRVKKSTTGVEVMEIDQENFESDSPAHSRLSKPRQATSSATKGKKRAEDGVEYSTPTKMATVDGTETSDGEEISPINFATSFAKRPIPSQSQETATPEEDSKDSDSDVSLPTESDFESEADGPSQVRKRKRSQKPQSSEAKRNKQTKRADSADRVECVRCHRFFLSEAHLRKHQKRPSSHIGLFKCLGCSEEFFATAALARHEQDTGHGKGNGLQGRVGAFSQKEVDKIHKWRDEFCEYHDITETQFNDMMTDTIERGKGATWKWSFVTRAEFLKEYIALLPNRNKRSMLRYRERNFQNLDGMKNWTAEDDKELVQLQKELGPKWAEIARRLGRTFDAVSQRWRHKLQYSQVKTGEWSKAEDNKFRKIIDELQHDSDGNELEDHRILWTKVSKKLGTRSAQQCSNHYRALTVKKHRGRYVKVEGAERTPASRRLSTPSDMDSRLSRGKENRRTSKNGLSEAFIREEEEEDDEDDEDETQQQDSVAQKSASQAEDEDKTESPTPSDEEGDSAPRIRNRNPLQAKTPGKMLRSSQLFEQTQANTSALKPSELSTGKKRGQQSQDRPSPNIPVRRQIFGSRSPLNELSASSDAEVDRKDEDQQGEEEMEAETETQDSSQEPGTTNKAIKEEDGADADQRTSPEDSADEDEVTGTENDDEISETDASVEESASEEVIKTKSDVDEELVGDEANEAASASSDEETPDASEDETQSTDQSEAVTESEEDNEDEAVGAKAAEEPPSSFMDSIKESAKRANIKKIWGRSQAQRQTPVGLPAPKRRSRRDIYQHESDEESD